MTLISFFRYFQDSFTKWIELIPLRNLKTENIAQAINDQIFCRYGLPGALKFDNAFYFTSNVVKQLLDTLGVGQKFSPPYSPRSNPVERTHRDIKYRLKRIAQEHKGRWADFLPYICYATRVLPHRATGFSPYFLLFGRDPNIAMSQLYAETLPSDDDNGNSLRTFVRDNLKHYQVSCASARKNLRTAILRQKHVYQRNVTPFEVDDLVLLYNPVLTPGTSQKFQRFWTGPHKIKKKINDVTYLLNVKKATNRNWNMAVTIGKISFSPFSRLVLLLNFNTTTTTVYLSNFRSPKKVLPQRIRSRTRGNLEHRCLFRRTRL